MRKLLLASVATLASTGGLLGTAVAQAPGPISPITVPAQPPTFSQGQVATTPSWSPPAGANNNNNYQAPMLPGAVANPTPGTIVVHLNGRVVAEGMGTWTSVDNHLVTATAQPGIGNATTAPAGSPGGPALAAGAATPNATTLGNNGIGSVKVQPQNISSYARLYAGADGMATNGLRYGAAIEIRENFTGQISNNGSSGASGYSSLETTYVRRAFVYMAGDQWGIVRAGQADGLISIYDNGVTTFQFLPSGNLNGGDLQDWPSSVAPPFVFLGQAGNEYDNNKLVYMSPQIAGFDFGLQYAPNTSNGFGMANTTNGLGNSIISSGTGTGLGCSVANSGCPSLSSGPGIQDGSRMINQTAVGVRYQGLLGGVGVLAYGVYEFSGHADYTGLTTPSILGITSQPGSKFNGQYNNLSIGSGGLALSYAGVTVGGNVIGGQMNGQLGLQPKNGAPLVGYLLGAKYTAGPLVFGIVGMEYWEQGTVTLAGITQRRARGIDTGVSYQIAPGLSTYAEYIWNDQYQGGNNFISGAINSNANNNLKGQGFLIGQMVNF
jgi:predicted porin